jgi:hypothetical protein
MVKRFLIGGFILLLTLGLPLNAAAQEYSFSLEREAVNVFWNSDGSMALDYLFVFSNQPGAHAIDYVDVGLPNANYSYDSIQADVSGNPVFISSDYQGSGEGVAVALGGQAIPAGQRGILHVTIGTISQVLHPDDDDDTYASAVFAPTWFGSQYVVGTTELSVTFHFPPGVQPEESRWHTAPSGFPSEPQTAIDDAGRITYTWSSPNASATRAYEFGASFPRAYVPAEAVVTQPVFDLTGVINFFFGNLATILCWGFFGFIFLIVPALSAIAGRRRKLQYMAPKISIEGHGIKRGLTAVESAILMEQSLDKVLTMILFGVIKKGAGKVLDRDPLNLEVTQPKTEGLQDYETKFLDAFEIKDTRSRRKALQDMVIALIKSVSEKMKGFSRNETIDYYKRIMETAWQQVQAAQTPELQADFFEKNLEWTMLDKDYDDRSRRVYRNPVYVPNWWGNYDPTYQTRPLLGKAGTSSPAAPAQPSGRSLPQLPGADFAGNIVAGVQTFSQKVVGDVSEFTSRVTNVTNPPPKPTVSSGGSRSGGGCACACACAGCACACAGGGR